MTAGQKPADSSPQQAVGLPRQVLVKKLVRSPPQLLEGKGETKIAQGIYQRDNKAFLLRVVYKEEDDIIKVITSYWTSKIDKYWEE